MPKKFFALIVSLSFLLLSCSSWFGNKTIEYDEEVKLSDGSMIWVHIKRHYTYVSAIGQGAGYKAGIVEISWDTGFEGVGRQSVFFDESIDFIDKIDGVWYVVGQKYPYAGSQEGIKSSNCQDIGVLINSDYHCVFRIDNKGEIYKTPIVAKDLGYVKMNILSTTLLNNDGNPMKEFLDKINLSWQRKIELQETQPKGQRIIGAPYSYDFLNSSNGGEL